MQRKRPDFSGQIVHAMNRAVEDKTLFHTYEDYAAFKNLLVQGIKKFKLRLLEWVIMPNHWHLILWPEIESQVPDFMQWLTSTHAKMLREESSTVGRGAVYQGRYRSTFIEAGSPLNGLRNYLAMNPVKAYLIDHPANWQWGSASRLLNEGNVSDVPLSIGPKPHPQDIEKILTDTKYLNQNQKSKIERAIRKETPIGKKSWKSDICARHNIRRNAKGVGRPLNNQ